MLTMNFINILKPFDRASIEPNFHDLYLKFLDKVNSKALNKEIVQATYENCKVISYMYSFDALGCCYLKWWMFNIFLYFQVLLGSELIKSSSEERSLLKNLGSWLGKLTIGRNQVLRAREIDPKSLIIEVQFFSNLSLPPFQTRANTHGKKKPLPTLVLSFLYLVSYYI